MHIRERERERESTAAGFVECSLCVKVYCIHVYTVSSCIQCNQFILEATQTNYAHRHYTHVQHTHTHVQCISCSVQDLPDFTELCVLR